MRREADAALLRSRGLRAFLAGLKGLTVALGLLVALGSATGVLRMGIGGRHAVVSGWGTEVPPWFVIAVALTFAASMFYLFAIRVPASRCTVEVDDGGVRWRRGSRKGYVPLARIRGVEQRGSAGGPYGAIVLNTLDGPLRLRTGASRPDLVEVIHERIRRGTPRPEGSEHGFLARGERDLTDWLASVRTSSTRTASEAYRNGGESLERVLADPACVPEARAAAVHALLAGADADCAARVARTLGPETPPIVIAAAAMAAPELVDRSLVEEALEYLAPGDAEAVRKAGALHVRVGAEARVSAPPEPPAALADEPDDGERAKLRRQR